MEWSAQGGGKGRGKSELFSGFSCIQNDVQPQPLSTSKTFPSAPKTPLKGLTYSNSSRTKKKKKWQQSIRMKQALLQLFLANLVFTQNKFTLDPSVHHRRKAYACLSQVPKSVQNLHSLHIYSLK